MSLLFSLTSIITLSVCNPVFCQPLVSEHCICGVSAFTCPEGFISSDDIRPAVTSYVSFPCLLVSDQ